MVRRDSVFDGRVREVSTGQMTGAMRLAGAGQVERDGEGGMFLAGGNALKSQSGGAPGMLSDGQGSS